MKNYRLPVCALLLTASIGHSSTFEESMNRLGVENPEFVVHMNLENDFQSLGTLLSQAYLAHLTANPEKPPVPINFNQLFGHLGLADITSTLWTSEALPEGGFINQSMIEFTEAPSGLFLLFGDENLPFSISSSAPASSDLAGEINFNGKVIFEILRSFVIDMMGPMGEGLIDGQMSQPLTPEGLTMGEVIERLETRMEIAIELNPESDPSLPSYMSLLTGNTVVRLNGLADLIDQFTPMLAGAGLLPIDGEPGAYKFSLPNPELPVSIYLYTLTDSNDVLLTLSETGKDWFLNSETSIGNSPEFLEIVEGLPTEGISMMYTSQRLSEMQIEGLGEGAAESKELAPLLTTLETFLKRYTGSQAAVSFIDGNALRSTARQPISYKTNLAISAGVVPATLAATLVPIIQQKMGTPPPAQEAEPDTSPID